MDKNGDMHSILCASRKAHDRTVALDTAVEMVQRIARMKEDGVIEVSSAGVHLTQAAFDAMPWGTALFTDMRLGEYTRRSTMVDGVTVFCLRNSAL